MKHLSSLINDKKGWHLFVDGAARYNPGPAGAGVYITKNKEKVIKKGFFLGKKTNNQAEYLALLIGLYILHKEVQPGELVYIFSDSLLLVKQLLGEYKVRNSILIPLFALAQRSIQKLQANIAHIVREHNSIADSLANKGIDEQIALPAHFISLLQKYEITI